MILLCVFSQFPNKKWVKCSKNTVTILLILQYRTPCFPSCFYLFVTIYDNGGPVAVLANNAHNQFPCWQITVVKTGSLACSVCMFCLSMANKITRGFNLTSFDFVQYLGRWQPKTLLPAVQLSVGISLCKIEYCASKALISELNQCNLLLKPWCWMEWAYVRWADGRLDQAGGVLDGQTGGRAPRRGPQCLVTVPRGTRCHLLPALHPHVSPTYKQTRTHTNTQGSWFGWKMRKRQSLPSVM